MNFQNEYLLNLNKYVKDKCSKICNFEKLEEKFLMNDDIKIQTKNLVLYQENFECFDKCSAKYFENGILCLKSFSNYISN
jgi:hypothetical protein